MRIKIVDTITVKQALLGVCAFSAAALAAALVAQFGFSLHPCELCLYQRYPYVAVAIIGGLAYRFAQSARMRWNLLLICALLLFADAGIAAYHTAVEYGWIPGPTACSSDTSGELTLEQMRAQIMNAPLVTCAQAMATIFGLSMAAWNALLAFAMALATARILGKNA